MEPLLKQLLLRWEKAFGHRVPEILENFSNNTKQAIAEFHADMKERRPELQYKAASFALLDNVVQTQCKNVKDSTMALQMSITNQQRKATRMLQPHIKKMMSPAFTECASEIGSASPRSLERLVANIVPGTGAYNRMRSVMRAHVNETKDDMYGGALEHVKEALDELCNSVVEDMCRTNKGVFRALEVDYRTAVVGSGPVEISQVVRDHVRELLLGANALFTTGSVGE